MGQRHDLPADVRPEDPPVSEESSSSSDTVSSDTDTDTTDDEDETTDDTDESDVAIRSETRGRDRVLQRRTIPTKNPAVVSVPPSPSLQSYVDERIPLLCVVSVRHKIPIFRLDRGGKPISSIESGRYGNSLCLFHSRRLLAHGDCSARDTSFSVFSTESWLKVHEMNHEKRVTCLRTLDSTTQDSLLVSGSYDHTVRLWDFSAAPGEEGGVERSRYTPHHGRIGGICTIPSRKWICSRCIEYDYSYRVWDVQSERTVHHQRDAIVDCIEYGNSFLITAEITSYAIRLTDIRTFESVKTFDGVLSRIRVIGIDSDHGNYLYAGETGGRIAMFDVRKESSAVVRKKVHRRAHEMYAEDIVSVGANRFASCCFEDVTAEKIRVWEGGTMKEVKCAEEPMKPEGRVTRLCCLNPFDGTGWVIGQQQEENERIAFLISRAMLDENQHVSVSVVVSGAIMLTLLKSLL